MRGYVLRVACCVNRLPILRLAYCGLLWVGFALMLRLLDRFALREDEAIYSYWALHFWRVDPYFLTVWPDKPPLFLWLLAGAFQLWGASQASGRFLNILLSLLTAVVVGAMARRLWGQQSGLVATTLYLFNPFALSFAPTVYTDPLLILTGQLALYSAITGRGLSAGLWLAAAMMTKQQGVLYVPLIVLALWLRPGLPKITIRSVNLWLRFAVGVLLVIAPIVYWDSTRWAVAPSPWDLSMRTYGRLAMAAMNQWLPRAYEWAKLLWYLTASWPVWLILIGGIIVALQFYQSNSERLRRPIGTLEFRNGYLHFYAKLTRPYGTKAQVALGTSSGKVGADNRIDAADLPGRFTGQPAGFLIGWLVLWCGGFLVVHIVTTIQIWDRYLLPLAPLLCLLVTWAFTQIRGCGFGCRPGAGWQQAAPQWRWLAALIGLLCLVPPALAATNGALPLGGDHGDYNGLTAVITRLRAEAPDDAILYHQRLGWHYQFYLFDEVTTGAYDLRWFPTPVYLAANAAQSPNHPRFLILPDWAPQPALALHLAARRLYLLPVAHRERMTLYRIQNQTQASCDWCRCGGHSPWPVWPKLDLSGESVQP